MDHLHALNQEIEKSADYIKPVYLAVIYYEKAFDSVEIAAVMKELRDKGVDEPYIGLLDVIYKDSAALSSFISRVKNFLLGRASGKEIQSSPHYY